MFLLLVNRRDTIKCIRHKQVDINCNKDIKNKKVGNTS